LNLSPELMHIVPSLPPMQYKYSKAATPQLLRLEVIGGIAIHPTLGSNRSTDD
jgi:hypothetical protein